MALKKLPLILLFFYAKDISQVQAENVVATYPDYDVYFRKVVNNSKDLLEKFDAVAGDVPAKYIAAADASGAKVFDYEDKTATDTTVQGAVAIPTADSAGTAGATTKEQAKVTTTVTDAPIDALKPTDATKPAPATTTAPPPPPAPNKA